MRKKFVLGLLLVFLGACSSFVNREEQVKTVVSNFWQSVEKGENSLSKDLTDLYVYSTDKDNIVYFVVDTKNLGIMPFKADLNDLNKEFVLDKDGYELIKNSGIKPIYQEINTK